MGQYCAAARELANLRKEMAAYIPGMTDDALQEVWLRGPLPGVPPLLQPAAHGLMQCREDVRATVAGMSRAQLAARPAGVASAAYHVVHAIGALDRLLTYARGESLTDAQLAYLADERRLGDDPPDAARLISGFNTAIERALAQLRATEVSTLPDARVVGRARLPSTVVGLLFHAAEHTQRHAGQLMTTAKVVRGGS
jgi:hypothetical protein